MFRQKELILIIVDLDSFFHTNLSKQILKFQIKLLKYFILLKAL